MFEESNKERAVGWVTVAETVTLGVVPQVVVKTLLESQ